MAAFFANVIGDAAVGCVNSAIAIAEGDMEKLDQAADTIALVGSVKNSVQGVVALANNDEELAKKRFGEVVDGDPVARTVKSTAEFTQAVRDGDKDRATQKIRQTVGDTAAGCVDSAIAIAEGDMEKLDRAADSITLVGPVKTSVQGVVALASNDEELAKQRFGKVADGAPVARTVKSAAEFTQAVRDGDKDRATQKIKQTVTCLAKDVKLEYGTST